MEPRNFDRLSRLVGKQTDRRNMLKAAAAGTFALLGLGALQRQAGANGGFNGDTCDFNSDCRDGLNCQNARRPLLGGLVLQVGPPAAANFPLFAGRSGTCRYNGGCADEGDSCQRNDDCCNGEDLFCGNNHCRKR
jgi:hypothetical protein